mmetsp:Transcript_2791/g.3795  ORF Transcript_2791/g.3795 Transcript_2791/m.3795 type:complete len:112 (-) Transcript_2791:288-623(-)|eukprot:CAMPEP_0196572996 /NCGR_PEP_ID=MMETSP1081-20130531/2970_1 /TAXON_ID=36882 /ORGANISM="Pyramimonas amylifera, Strain CCMP720" /LENGTH=111 /DNA_ID=CAMNT_0041890539 /DNA_START=142 /DNA_END=477 /DNA_ORIENTATION=-
MEDLLATGKDKKYFGYPASPLREIMARKHLIPDHAVPFEGILEDVGCVNGTFSEWKSVEELKVTMGDVETLTSVLSQVVVESDNAEGANKIAEMQVDPKGKSIEMDVFGAK